MKAHYLRLSRDMKIQFMFSFILAINEMKSQSLSLRFMSRFKTEKRHARISTSTQGHKRRRKIMEQFCLTPHLSISISP
jgi:hypothetical protein